MSLVDYGVQDVRRSSLDLPILSLTAGQGSTLHLVYRLPGGCGTKRVHTFEFSKILVEDHVAKEIMSMRDIA